MPLSFLHLYDIMFKIVFGGSENMNLEQICALNRNRINIFIREHWFTTIMIIRGKEVDMNNVEGYFVTEHDEIVGLITYILYDNTLEIISLDSLREKCGIGTLLVNKVISVAKDAGCKRIVLITTNDNLNAMGFYQKRGFDMSRLYRNALDISRKMKPEIPLLGENDIPLKHEIEFEMVL